MNVSDAYKNNGETQIIRTIEAQKDANNENQTFSQLVKQSNFEKTSLYQDHSNELEHMLNKSNLDTAGLNSSIIRQEGKKNNNYKFTGYDGPVVRYGPLDRIKFQPIVATDQFWEQFRYEMDNQISNLYGLISETITRKTEEEIEQSNDTKKDTISSLVSKFEIHLKKVYLMIYGVSLLG
jgi:hypothetical protein